MAQCWIVMTGAYENYGIDSAWSSKEAADNRVVECHEEYRKIGLAGAMQDNAEIIRADLESGDIKYL